MCLKSMWRYACLGLCNADVKSMWKYACLGLCNADVKSTWKYACLGLCNADVKSTWKYACRLSLSSFILQSVLRQVHSLLQSDFSTECELVFLLQFPVSSHFHKVIQKLLKSSSSSSRHFCVSFNHVFQKADPTQDMTNPFSLPSFNCIYIMFFFSSLFVILLLFLLHPIIRLQAETELLYLYLCLCLSTAV
jgi:hypothetical protein